MNSIKFTKINGAGNDFILIDESLNNGITLDERLIQKLCDRRRGIGADGILLIEKDLDADFKFTYYNSDGSIGSLCGNGSRCSLYYFLHFIDQNKKEVNFKCNDEIFSGGINTVGDISFNLPDPQSIRLDIPIEINNYRFNAHFIEVGSPHLVIFWEDIKKYFQETFEKFNLYEFGKLLRYSEYFKPGGTNVNIIHNIDGNYYIRTYERGVEEETLSCGTGSASAAIITGIKKGLDSPIVFTTFGGDFLNISFIKEDENFSKITLTGPVKINYIGSCNF